MSKSRDVVRIIVSLDGGGRVREARSGQVDVTAAIRAMGLGAIPGATGVVGLPNASMRATLTLHPTASSRGGLKAARRRNVAAVR